MRVVVTIKCFTKTIIGENMKITAIITTLFLSVQVFAASTTLITRSMYVAFAPPEFRGEHKTEIKSDGVIRYISNKGKVFAVAKLSASAVKSLKQKIAAFEYGPLVGEDGPECMDAPSIQITLNKGGKDLVISETVNCKTKQMSEAYELVEVINSAHGLTQLVN